MPQCTYDKGYEGSCGACLQFLQSGYCHQGGPDDHSNTVKAAHDLIAHLAKIGFRSGSGSGSVVLASNSSSSSSAVATASSSSSSTSTLIAENQRIIDALVLPRIAKVPGGGPLGGYAGDAEWKAGMRFAPLPLKDGDNMSMVSVGPGSNINGTIANIEGLIAALHATKGTLDCSDQRQKNRFANVCWRLAHSRVLYGATGIEYPEDIRAWLLAAELKLRGSNKSLPTKRR